MSVIIETSIPSTDFGFGTVFSDTTADRFELKQIIPIQGGTLAPFVRAYTANIDALETQLATDERITDITLINEFADSVLFQIDWNPSIDGFFTVVSDHDGLILTGTGTPNRWEFQLQFPDHETLSAFAGACRDAEVSLNISRIYTPSETDTEIGIATDIAAQLTASQRETLKIALEKGYFEIPRQISLDELAEKSEISGVAIDQRLRRGLTTVLEQVFIGGNTDNAEKSSNYK